VGFGCGLYFSLDHREGIRYLTPHELSFSLYFDHNTHAILFLSLHFGCHHLVVEGHEIQEQPATARHHDLSDGAEQVEI